MRSHFKNAIQRKSVGCNGRVSSPRLPVISTVTPTVPFECFSVPAGRCGPEQSTHPAVRIVEVTCARARHSLSD